MGAFVLKAAQVAGRVLAAWALVAGGTLALAAAVAAGIVGGRPDSAGAVFTTSLTPVHTDGHALVVPDVGSVLARHGVGRLLGDGRLAITVRSASLPARDLIAELVPTPDAVRFYGGTAHAEVLSVGYTTGLQPVQAVDRPGEAPTGAAPWERVHSSAQSAAGLRELTLVLEVPSRDPVALVIRRADRQPDLTVAITVGFTPASWGVATMTLGVGGVLATLSGLALLLVRRSITVEIPVEVAEVEPGRPPSPVRRISPYVYTAT